MSILPDASKLEMYLLDYSLAVVSKVAFLDAGSSPHPYQHIAIALNMGPNSILFNCVVAHSAAHLNQAGHVSEQVLLARKSRALHSLRTAIMSAISGQHSYPDANEMNFCASVMLVGLATTEGSPLSEVLQLVKGSAILWNEYRRTTQGDDSMLSNSTKRMLAYFDILSSVPYPRAPALPVDMWLGSGNVVGQSFHIDPLMGCLTNLFALIAECSRSIFHYYSGNTNHLDFTAQKTSLLNHLSQWQHPLPADFEAIHGYDWTTSAHAGEAYKLATQIYLLCSCNSQIDSRLAASHVRQLRYAVFSIPVHSPFIAMMLWPAFVLGCETREQIQRERIEKWFQDVFVKQGFGNIRVALNALKCIWRLMDSRAAQAERSKLPSEGAFLCREEDRVTCQSQSKYSWVMLCWEEQISRMYRLRPSHFHSFQRINGRVWELLGGTLLILLLK